MKLLTAALILAPFAGAQMPADCPMHAEHMKTCAEAQQSEQHRDMVMKHGEQGMGFSQTATFHHFLANGNGGTIQVEAKNAKDTKSRDEIRMHLGHIAKAFAEGDFDIPMFVHDTKSVPGVADMQRLKSEIEYKYVETKRGGKVEIASENPEAIAAVHKFLAFQIEEHRTGDKLPKN